MPAVRLSCPSAGQRERRPTAKSRKKEDTMTARQGTGREEPMTPLDDVHRRRDAAKAKWTAKRALLEAAIADAVEKSLEDRVDQLELAVAHLPKWIAAVSEKVGKLRSEMYRMARKKEN